MTDLFAPTTLHTLTLRNRFIRSATWTGTADSDGFVTDEWTRRMVQLGRGGVGLIVAGHAYVSPEGKASPGQLSIADDRCVPLFRQAVAAVHGTGAKIAAQLAHGGVYAADTAPPPRKAVSKPDPDVPGETRVFDDRDIDELIAAFVSAGLRAEAAGFDAAVLHAAHGYLLSQFISPYFNKREDTFGGDVERRATVPVRIVKALRDALGPDFPLIVKINGSDYIENGLEVSDAATTAGRLAEAGANAVEVSGGLLRNIKFSPSRMGISAERKEAYFREDARRIKEELKIPVILVGGIRSLTVAESTVETGAADFIALSRPLICEPDLIARWQSGDKSPSRCKSDNRCFKPGLEGLGIACAHLPT